MTKTASQVLRKAELYSDGQDYRILQLPPNGITLAAGIVAEAGLPFSALTADKDEVTLILADRVYKEFGARLRRAKISEQVYRLITFGTPLEPDLVGFIARVSTALAAAEIPVLTFASYSRDHIFVPQEAFDQATHTLRALQMESE